MLLVPALAWMQYQWLGQLSEAERERMQRTLRTAAAQFATEFDTELSRTLVSLQVDGATVRDQNWTAYAQRYSRVGDQRREPRLVRDVWLVDTLPAPTLPAFDGTHADPDRSAAPSPLESAGDDVRRRRSGPTISQKVRDSLAHALRRLRRCSAAAPSDNTQHREATFSSRSATTTR